jgi:hypothetical protein
MNGTLRAGDPGAFVATGYTNTWNKGTIKLEVVLYDNGGKKADVKNTCYSATSCHNNPTPIVTCGCPGLWDMYVYASGPKTNGSTDVSFHTSVEATLVGGKLVLQKVS